MNRVLFFHSFIILSLPMLADGGDASASEKELYSEAVEAFELGDYREAFTMFEELTKLDGQNAEYYFLTGLALYEAEFQMTKAIEFMERSIELFNGDTIAEVYLYLARASLETEQFDAAKSHYNTFKSLLKGNGAGEQLGEQVDVELTWLENAEQAVHLNSITVRHQGIEVINLGDGINSEYGDYAPVKLVDDQLAFTSRRPNVNGNKAHDGQWFEDIYFGNYNGNTWNIIEKVEKSTIYEDYNSRGHDAFVENVSDGTTIYIYRKNGIWVSKYVEGAWTELVEVEEINKNSNHTPSVAITADGKTMYFSHEEGDGYGGKDIYVTTLGENGEWNKPTLMSSDVNTDQEEDAPFLSPDGTTLYFASKGHESIGGFDLFKLDLTEPGAKPEALPYPINSTADDIFIVTDDLGESGFLSSNRPSTIGMMDIYEFNMNLPAIEAEFVGIAFDPTTDQTVFPQIIVLDAETGEAVNSFKPDENGNYAYTLQTDKSYVLQITEGDIAEFSNQWYVPRQTQMVDNHQVLMLKELETGCGYVLEVRSSFEEINEEIEDWKAFMLAEMYEETETFNYIYDTIMFDVAVLSEESDYRKFYGYNLNELDASDRTLDAWFDNVQTIIECSGGVILQVEGSASNVPTKTYGTNTKLADIRANNGKVFILKTLKERGVDVTGVEFVLNSGVNGPSYRGDFEKGKDSYGEFQYVNFSVVKD